MTNLEQLYLDNFPISDVGLVHLEGLTKLPVPSVGGNAVTAAGVARLVQALPNCHIRHW